MFFNENTYVRKFLLSLGLTGFGLLLVCFLLGGHAVLSIGALNSANAIDEEALALRSKAAEPREPIFGELPPTAVLVIAGVLAILIVANAMAEANSDSFLGELKRRFGRTHLDHIFLPVLIKVSGNEVLDGYMVRLNKRHANFFLPKALSDGARVSFRSKIATADSKNGPWFHGVVAGTADYEASNCFEVEIRLHAESVAEKASLSNWIASLEPALLSN